MDNSRLSEDEHRGQKTHSLQKMTGAFCQPTHRRDLGSSLSALRVGIACNIKADHASDEQAEFDEPETIAAISDALRAGGFEPIVMEASEGFPRKLEAEKPDIVFNVAEGKSGRSREAQIPAILEYYGVPYTGSDAAALAVAMDKALAKRVAQNCGIRTPVFAVIPAGALELPGDLPYPVLIKPNAEGSSKGIPDNCVAENFTQLRCLAAQMAAPWEGDLLAEQYIEGREFTVGILGARVFDPMEVIFHKQRGPYKVYSREIKKNFHEYVTYQCPPDLPKEVKERMMRDAQTVFSTLGCLDFARIDFRLSQGGEVYFIEANPLPGLAPGYSDFPMLAEFHGIEYGELIREMLHQALKRYGMEAMNEDGRAK